MSELHLHCNKYISNKYATVQSVLRMKLANLQIPLLYSFFSVLIVE